MKSIFKNVFVILMVALCFLAFGCKEPGNNPDDNTKSNVASIEVDQDSVKAAIAMEIFDYHTIDVKVTYTDGKTETIKLNNDMLTENELKKFEKSGKSITINVTYGGKSTSFDVKMPYASVKKLEVDAESFAACQAENYFDYSKVKMHMTSSNGVVQDTLLNADMFSYSDLAKFYLAGEHEVEINFLNCKTTFKFNNAKNYYIDIETLANIEEGASTAIYGYTTFYTSADIYLHSDKGGTYAKSTSGVINSAVEDEVLGNDLEVVLIGKKTSENGISILADVKGVATTANKYEALTNPEVEKAADLDKNLYNYVDFENAKFVSVTTLSSKTDTVITATDGTKEFKIVLQQSLGSKLLQSIFCTVSEMFKGHELVIENVVPSRYKNETVLFVTEKSLLNYVDVSEPYHAPVEGERNEAFDDVLDEFFIWYFGESPFNINWYIYDVEAFDAKYGTDYAHAKVVPSNVEDQTPEYELDYYQEMLDMRAKLLAYDEAQLSYSQRLDYSVIMDWFDRELQYFIFNEAGENVLYYYGTNLGSYLGYQAQLPSLLADYRFDDKKDIEDYLDYLKTTKNDFEAIYAFELSKIETGKGNQLADYVVDEVIDQCKDFINAGDENYLIATFDGRIDECSFLTEEEKADYKAKDLDAVNNYFVPAYKWLKDKMTEYKDLNNDKTAGALCNTEYGKEYYQVKFQDACGSDLTIEELLKYLDEKIAEYDALCDLYAEYDGNLMEDAGLIVYNDKKKIEYYDSLYSIIPFLQEKVKGDFPEVGAAYTMGENITINEIPDSLKDHSSPAYYLTSTIDQTANELIYINPKDFGEVNSYMFQTIGHEGWPGHLYQNVYYKAHTNSHDVRMVLGYKSYSEGWANYVENYVVKYAVDNYGSQQIALHDAAGSLFTCKIDIGVNYQGWGVEDVIKAYGLTLSDVTSGKYTWSSGDTVSYDDFEDIYYFYCDVPTNYLMYFYSCCELLDIKADFREKMGVYYSEELFHTIYLETGDCSWKILKQAYNDYAAKWGTNGTERAGN